MVGGGGNQGPTPPDRVGSASRRCDEQCHERQRHSEDHPPVRTAPSHRRAQSIGGVGPSSNHAPTIRTGHTCRTRRSGAQAPLAPVPAGVEGCGDRVRSVRPARPSNSRGRGGRRGPGPRRISCLPHAGQSACGPIPRGRSRCGTTPRPVPRSPTGLTARRSPWTGRVGAEAGSGWPRGGRVRRTRRSCPDHSRKTSHAVDSSSQKNSSPSSHSPPRPHCSFPATMTRPGIRTCTSIRQMKGSISASRSSTRTRRAASSLCMRPDARRMWSTTSHGEGHGGGASSAPSTRAASPGSRRATSRRARTALRDRPIDCHSAVI